MSEKKKLAITLSIPSEELIHTGQGSVYKQTHIIEVENLPKEVLGAINGGSYCGSVFDISFVKEN